MSDLAVLLREMRPVLHATPYGFTLAEAAPADAFAAIREEEGLTVIAPGAAEMDGWARISLSVHSSLSAVGLTAAFSGALAGAGISCNTIAGFHHDHLFVPWDRRHDAMAALAALSETHG
ncbi:MAG TPA: ACT domain-containing protein [Sphingomonas sp.]